MKTTYLLHGDRRLRQRLRRQARRSYPLARARRIVYKARRRLAELEDELALRPGAGDEPPTPDLRPPISEP